MSSNAETIARSAAAAAGLALTENGAANIVALIETGASFTPGQEIDITLDGATMPVTAWLQDLVASSPSWFAAAAGSTSTPPAPLAGETMTAHAVRINSAAKQNRARELANEAAAGPNPFAPSTFNLTRQMAIRASNPGLATILEQEASR